MFESIIDPIFRPLLNLGPLLALLIISFVASLIIVIIYKLMTKQDIMKDLKAEIKELQKEMKALKDNPTKMMEVQKKAMSKNLEYMKHSFKPTLITFLPLILIFGWLNTSMAYTPILPGSEFNVSATFEKDTIGTVDLFVPESISIINNITREIKNVEREGFLFSSYEIGEAKWTLKGDAGEYLLEYNFDGKSYTKDVLITNEQAYKNPIKKIENSQLKSLEINNEKMKVLNLFGWKLGWLGTYIIFSLVFSILLRKLLKVH